MKKGDFILVAFFAVLFLPFFLFDQVLDTYRDLNHEYPYLASFIKFFVFASAGEVL